MNFVRPDLMKANFFQLYNDFNINSHAVQKLTPLMMFMRTPDFTRRDCMWTHHEDQTLDGSSVSRGSTRDSRHQCWLKCLPALTSFFSQRPFSLSHSLSFFLWALFTFIYMYRIKETLVCTNRFGLVSFSQKYTSATATDLYHLLVVVPHHVIDINKSTIRIYRKKKSVSNISLFAALFSWNVIKEMSFIFNKITECKRTSRDMKGTKVDGMSGYLWGFSIASMSFCPLRETDKNLKQYLTTNLPFSPLVWNYSWVFLIFYIKKKFTRIMRSIFSFLFYKSWFEISL